MAQVNNIYSIIKAPLITEKNTDLIAQRKYVFMVDTDATKIAVRQAVEKIYSVKVTAVSTMVMKGKHKRLRNNRAGKRPDWKKAVVTLKKGSEIKFA